MRGQSGVKLPNLVDDIRALVSGLSSGDRVLIAEACRRLVTSVIPAGVCCCCCTCRQSGGNLPLIVDGIRALASGFTAGDRVLHCLGLQSV